MRRGAAAVLTLVLAGVFLALLARGQGGGLPGESAAISAPGRAPVATGTPQPALSEAPTLVPELAAPGPAALLTPGIPLASAEAIARQLAARSEIVFATANLYIRMPWPQARADLDRLAARAQVIGLNEISAGRAVDLRGWASTHPGWELVRPVHPSSTWSGSNAVLVRTDTFDVLRRGVVFGSRASMPGYRIDSRWITWVQLRERETGRGVVYLQTHMDAAVETAGVPRRSAGRRIANNVRYMHTLERVAETFARTHDVVVGGDWNVNAFADRRVGSPRLPFRLLENGGAAGVPGLRSSYTELGFGVPPTSAHAGGRWIDYLAVWHRGTMPGPAFLDHQVLTGVNSDHNPLLATVQFGGLG